MKSVFRFLSRLSRFIWRLLRYPVLAFVITLCVILSPAVLVDHAAAIPAWAVVAGWFGVLILLAAWVLTIALAVLAARLLFARAVEIWKETKQ